jgi:serine/threonine-protein kinase
MLTEVIGSYRVLRQLGAGGMGVVYLAQHTVIGRHAAIKLLLPQYSADPEIVGRFFNEARSAALIRHPGLVDVYDFGRLPDGSAYLVMEYLTGETLASMLARHVRLPEEVALALARQIAAAVGAAHTKGIVHRDLKPDNIFVVQDEEVPVGVRARILDFGIAKLSVELAEHGVKTRTGSFIGTPVYMSPEQCRGARSVDGRSDIYSLGCILFELVTGKRVFLGEGVGEIIGAHQYLPPPVPSSVERSVPAWLDAVILKTLAKRPEDRYQTMEELAAALGGRPRSVTSQPPAPGPTVPMPPISTVRRGVGEITGPSSLLPIPGKRRGRVGIVAAAAALAAGALLFVALRTGSKETPAQPAVAPAPDFAPSVPPPPAPTPAETPPQEPAPVPVPEVKPPEPAPEPVPAMAMLSSEPADGEVFALPDRAPLGKTPLSVPADGAYEIKLAGFNTARVKLRGADKKVKLVTRRAGKTSPPKETYDPFAE